MDRRLFRYCLLLALPTAALVVFGLFFLFVSVPRIAASEHARAEEESKEFAERLKDGTARPDFVWEYGKGVLDDGSAPQWAKDRFRSDMTWKDWNSRGAKRKADMWGWHEVRIPSRARPVRMVWARRGMLVHAACANIEEFDYVFWSWLVLPLLMAALVAATASAVWRLVSYARTRDDFLAAAAHDLTTPLVGMRFLIGSDDDEAKTLNERMLRLVGNITDFLSRGGRRKAPRKESFNVKDAFDAAYRIFAADYEEEKSGPVKVSCDGSPVAVADIELTTQILWNLLGNDLKYAAPFGNVSARFRTDDDCVLVEIADEGPGMTPWQMKRAFDRYWRAKTVLKSGKGGFGIGLCTSRDYARAMGGDLTLGPNSPCGCIFTLRLPAT